MILNTTQRLDESKLGTMRTRVLIWDESDIGAGVKFGGAAAEEEDEVEGEEVEADDGLFLGL